MDNSLIAMLVIVALSAISNWMQKRSQAQEQGPTGRDQRPTRPASPPHPPTQPPRTRQADSDTSSEPDWERDIRRLFEGDAPQTPPPFPQMPPVLQTASPTAPPRSSPPAPRSISTPSERIPGSTEGPSITLINLTESEEAYRQASHLHEKTAAHLRRVTSRTRQPRAAEPTLHRHRSSSEVHAAAALVRDPKTVRQAVIASMILESPKGFSS